MSKSKSASAPATKPVLRLVASTTSQKPESPLKAEHEKNALDCIDELVFLLEEASRGEAIGIAYICIRSADYRSNAVGLAAENPTFTIGALEMLKSMLMPGGALS